MRLGFDKLLAPLTLSLALSLAACDDGDDIDDTPLTAELANAGGKIVATTQITVEPYKRGCTGDEDNYSLCKRAAAVDPADEHDYNDHIHGFQNQWGHRYTLEINVVELPEAFADGSTINFELVSILDDQLDLDDEFELPTYAFNLEPGASSGVLIDQTPVTCAPEVCDAIAAISDAPSSPMVRVRFGDEQPLPLVAVELMQD